MSFPPHEQEVWGQTVVQCTMCQAVEHWSNERAAKAAAVWHIYEHHRDVWVRVIGAERPPVDSRPEAYGVNVHPEVQDQQDHPQEAPAGQDRPAPA